MACHILLLTVETMLFITKTTRVFNSVVAFFVCVLPNFIYRNIRALVTLFDIIVITKCCFHVRNELTWGGFFFLFDIATVI